MLFKRQSANVKVVRTRKELAEALENAEGKKRGLAMTMGALHEGHLDLVRALKKVSEYVVVTIFVNPTQFAPGEDFEAYPRNLEADVAKLEGVGADLIFAPTAAEVYPEGPGEVTINPGEMAQVLEGVTRPTHFAGVCQVVAKMFHLVRPDIAAFGRKDAQQLAIVTRMVKDLDYPIRILPVEIRREHDGLALSSRNAYLTPDQRRIAPTLYRALQAGEVASEVGPRSSIVSAVRAVLDTEPSIYVDYVALVDPDTFMPPSLDYKGSAVLALAAKIGQTRLIDNVLVEV